MPTYEYACEAHGPFSAFRPMAASGEPCDCPECGASSPRVILTAPAFGARNRGLMQAHAVNERAADSPKRASQHVHGPNCGCGAGRKTNAAATLHRPDGSKSFPAKRPWMISH